MTALPHPDLDCSAARPGGIDIQTVITSDLTGDGVPELIVKEECKHDASEWPDSVYVYSNDSGTPTLVGTLLQQSESSYATGVAASGTAVTLKLAAWSSFAPGCCPDLAYTQRFTWNGHAFTAGPRTPVVGPCGDTAFAVTADSPQGAAGHGTVVLLFRNRLPIPCTVHGYPGLDALDSAGNALAHANRTPTGMAGGSPGGVPTVTVAPGGTASARVEWSNVGSGGTACATSASIATTPANATTSVTLPVAVSTCDLQVHPTVAGITGNG